MADYDFTADYTDLQTMRRELLGVAKDAERSAGVFERAYRRVERHLFRSAKANQKYYNEVLKVDTAQKKAYKSASVFERELGKQERRIGQLRAKYSPLAAASMQYERALNEINEAHSLGAISIRQHEAALESLNAEYQQFQAGAVTANNQFAAATQRSTRSMGNSQVVIQQAGYQIGDFIVQVQSGTNAFVAFGQQATQMAGLLTTFGGALVPIGAALSIAIPLATAFGAALMRTRQDADDAKTAIEQATQSLEQWNQTIAVSSFGVQDFGEFGLESNLREAQARLESFQRQLAEAEAESGREATQRARTLIQQVESQEEVVKLAREELENYQFSRELQEAITETKKRQAEQAEAEAQRLEDAQTFYEDQLSTMNDQIRLLELQAQYGEDSAQVQEEINAQARMELLNRAESLGLSEKQTGELLRLLQIQQDIASEIANSNSEADRLARTLGITTVEAQRLLNVFNGISGFNASSTVGQIMGIARALGVATAEAIRLAQSMPGYTSSGVTGPDAAVNQVRDRYNVVASSSAIARDLANLPTGSASIGSGGGSGGGGGGAAELSAFEKVVQSLERSIQEMKDEAASATVALQNMTVVGDVQAYIKKRTELLTAAREDELEITDDLVAQIDELASAYAKQVEDTEAVTESLEEYIKKMEDAKNLGGELFDSLFDALQDGDLPAFFEDLADKAVDSFQAIVKSALEGTTSITQAFQQSFSMINQGISGIGTALSGGGGSLLGSIGTAISGVMPVIGAATSVFNLIKGFSSTKVIDQGMVGNIGSGNTYALDFTKKEKSTFWGLFKSTSTSYDENEAVTKELIEARLGIVKEVNKLANGLGGAVGNISKVNQSFDVDSQEELNAAMEEYANKVAKAALGTDKFNKTGETTLEALERLSSGLVEFNSVLGLVGITKDKSVGGAVSASNIIESAGGMGAVSAGVDSYISNILSPEEQQDLKNRELRKALNRMGVNPNGLSDRQAFQDRFESLKDRGFDKTATEFLTLAPLFEEISQYRDEVNATKQAQKEATEAQREANRAANKDQYRQLLIQLYTLQGKVNEVRRIELQAIDESNKGIQEHIWRLQDQQAIEQEREALELQLFQIKGDTNKLRNREVRELDNSNKALQRRIYKLQDEQAIEQEREALELQLLQVKGETDKLRNREVRGLDNSNKALQRRIYKLQDEQAIANERESLETQLLQLQGNTNELRRRELEALNPVNRELQRMIWGLEDAQQALEDLKPEDFATKFLFEQAQARARREFGAPDQSIMGIRPANVSEDAQEIITTNLQGLESVRDAVADFHKDMRELTIDIRRIVRKDYQLKKDWDAVGLPPTRT